MYLKQIEIHGFKSFANDTVMKFEKGITGIVGPNGSGKSNIADAVRWVLGEQKTKQQRVQSMQDVIFSGTERRKAQGFAYVSLTIDNSDRKINLDFDEIQVSRRLYRSGDSEYMLNGEECRLKDINELFYDTGIGKEGYSIIGQGQIDRILSNKPEDRRELFDEAVGIVKYKRRKAVAEKKLEEEQLNISRVTDIMGELARQVEPLRKQSEAAKQYLSLRDELINYEANFFVRAIDKESKIVEENTVNLENVTSDLKEAKLKKDEFNEKYTEIDNTISQLDLDTANLRDSLSENNALKENLNGKINVIKEQINSENQSNQSRTDRIAVLKDSMFKMISNIEDDVAVLSNIKSQINIIKQNDVSIESSDANVDSDLSLIDNSINKVKDNIVTMLGNDYNFDFDRKYNDASLEDTILTNFNAKQKDIADIDTRINEKIEEMVKLDEDARSKQTELDTLTDKIMEAQNNFHAKETKLETIKNMLERYEGYGQTVKQVMDERDSFDGIKGVVADIIKTDKEYEVAIETALGNTMQNIVVSNEETAKSVINYLKDNKLGRVTFLPLTTLNVKDNDMYEEAKSEAGVIDIAKNLTNYDSEYDTLAEYLLSRCLVVDNFDSANNINKKYNYGLKIVTLSGELFNPGGSIAGGAYKNSLSLLGRKREYDDVKLEIDKLVDEIDKLNADKKRCSEEYDSLYNNTNKVKEDISNLQIEKNTLTLNVINDIKLEYSHISEQAKWTSQEIDRLVTELRDVYIEKTTLESKDQESVNVITSKEQEINDINAEIEKLTITLDEINKSINDKNEEKTRLLANRQEYFESKDRLSNELISLEQESFKLKAVIEKSTQKIEELTEKNYQEYEMTYDSAKMKYDENLGDVDELKKLVGESKKKISSLGPININAIEDYAELSGRYETTITQYEDLKKSEEMILKIVAELDENMRTQFEENFKLIKSEFDKVFKELFGGGKATLTLLESDTGDELDAGVQIEVQPPGKKLGSLSQLSGGEKALTAIALMFAIQNLKPSPFCLLDEIEAALDESNVDRFAEYLRNLVEETQFILITHRRGTMEKTDRLYGVTMQEKGVTALVSVNLVEDQLS